MPKSIGKAKSCCRASELGPQFGLPALAQLPENHLATANGTVYVLASKTFSFPLLRLLGLLGLILDLIQYPAPAIAVHVGSSQR